MTNIKSLFKKTLVFFMISVLVFSFAGCEEDEAPKVQSDGAQLTEKAPEKQKTEEEIRMEKVLKTLENMTLEQKVGQLFLVQPEAMILSGERKTATYFSADMVSTLNEYPVGGFILFGGNVVSPSQLLSFTGAIKENAGEIPFFIGIDEEGGRVARIGQNSSFGVATYSSMEKVGSSGDPNAARQVGETIGEYLKNYGFNLDFAPVADVNTNPQNRVIGDRAFGSDPNTVSQMVNAAISGFQSKNIMTCVKHFPGHGNTKGDTHKDYVSVTKSWEELKKCELIPFINAFDKTDMVMVAHVTAVNVTSDSLPATLSYEMITEKLRNELGYNGVVITDSLSMGAIKKNYSSAEAALKAFKAGADILLMPEDLGQSFDAILNTVKSGEISEDRLDQSVARILDLKLKYN